MTRITVAVPAGIGVGGGVAGGVGVVTLGAGSVRADRIALEEAAAARGVVA